MLRQCIDRTEFSIVIIVVFLSVERMSFEPSDLTTGGTKTLQNLFKTVKTPFVKNKNVKTVLHLYGPSNMDQVTGCAVTNNTKIYGYPIHSKKSEL